MTSSSTSSLARAPPLTPSATQNRDDGGRRRCISVNLPEPIAEDSAAATAGFATVSDITLARITKVIDTVDGAERAGLRRTALGAEQLPSSSGRRRDDAASTCASQRSTTASTTWSAIAAEVLLKEGVPLDAPWERHEAGGAPVIIADGVAVVLSLDVTDEIVGRRRSALEPRVVVFLEDGFAGADAVKANAFTNAKNLGITLKTV